MHRNRVLHYVYSSFTGHASVILIREINLLKLNSRRWLATVLLYRMAY